MQLNELKDNPGARKERMRVGRGIGSGKGKTCGRGMKGQRSRSGHKINGYEGGQMPIYRRLPQRGFVNYGRKNLVGINLDRLQDAVNTGRLDDKKTVTEQMLIDAGVTRRARDGIKILGRGEIKAKLTLEVSGASRSAIQKIEKAGGKVTVLKTSEKEEKATKKAQKAESDSGSKETAASTS